MGAPWHDGGVADDQTKTCSHCGKSKPTWAFYRNRGALDGLQSWCGCCQLDYKRRRYREYRSWLHLNPHRRPRWSDHMVAHWIFVLADQDVGLTFTEEWDG